MSKTRRIVLLGKTGTGKSSLGNTIFGDDSAFSVVHSPNSGTHECGAVTRTVHGRHLTLIDTPGLFDTDPNSTNAAFGTGIMKCLEVSAPGPHAFLLLLKIDKFTAQERAVVNLILQYFSEKALQYTTIVFTHGNNLPAGMRVEDWARENDALRKLLAKCGNRCHVVDNTYWKNPQGPIYRNNHNQVRDLLDTVDRAVAANGGSYYTNEFLRNPSLWRRFRDAPIGLQVAAVLGVAVVGVFLYQVVPWSTVMSWVATTAKEGAAWAATNLPSKEALRDAVAYLAALKLLFEQIPATATSARQVCVVL